MDRPFIYCSFKNNKNKEIVKNSLIMEDFSPQEALYYMSIIKAETCGEAIDECIRLKKIDDNKSQEAPSIEELLKDDTEYCDNDDELQITEDLIDFLITYKKYSRKDAESIADITPGTTLGERIANATKPRKRKNQ